MKKNITINLCGRLFAIDEDAYELLSTYLKSLRTFFRQREGDEEIADDIEARVAELFDEQKQKGAEAINIEYVQEVIHRIGQPDEMEEDEGTAPSNSPKGEDSDSSEAQTGTNPLLLGGGREGAKRLFRNPADKKLMGVLSGFAAYFGGDVLWWRLGYAAIVLLSFAGSSYNFLWFMPHRYLYFRIWFWGVALIIAYILLAVLMPVAETPEDRLRMKGKEVNPQNLADEVTEEAARQQQFAQQAAAASSMSGQPAGHKGPQGCVAGTIGCIGGFFSALWAVIATLFRWCIYAAGAFLAVMCLVGIVGLIAVALNPQETLFQTEDFMRSAEFLSVLPSLKLPFIIFAVAAFVVLAITAYAIIHSLLNEFKQMPSMPYRQRIALLIMWIVGLIVAGAAFGYGVPKYAEAESVFNSRTYKEWENRYRAENTHDGIYVKPVEWEFLQDGGWRILNAQGCNDRFTATGQHFKGDRYTRYLDCYDEHHRQRYRVERADTLQPGTYRLTCAARANGTGAFIYAMLGDGQPQFMEIPATGNTGGDIWVEADKFHHYHKDIPIPSDSVPYGHEQCELWDVNNHRGFGWSRITFEPIHVTTPIILRYGLTSDDAFTGSTWLGQWFSATDFEVSRVEK